MISLGWNPEKVIELKWEVNGRHLTFKSEYGLLAVVVPNRRSIAVMKENDDSGSNSSLIILDVNGAIKFRVQDKLVVDGKEEGGVFCWFEPARNNSLDCVGVVFRLDKDQSMVQVDVESNTGDFVGIYPMR